MARWTGTWLSGLGAAGVGLREPGDYQGRRLGLPEEGAGAVASLGARLAAFVVDIVLAALIGGLLNLFVQPTDLQRNLTSTSVFAVMTLLGYVVGGQARGMWLLGLRVRSLEHDAPTLGLVPAALRTALLVLFLPALVNDRDGRGLHDRAARTVVVRTA